jgi:hypothetical protein
MPYVYSTATNSSYYCAYDSTPGSPSVLKKKVEIRGGHNLNAAHNAAQKNNIYTPYGVRTEVSDADLEFLLGNPTFNRHVKLGFLSVDNKKVSPEKKARDMEQKDGSAPLTPKDFDTGASSDSGLKTYAKKVDSMPTMSI